MRGRLSIEEGTKRQKRRQGHGWMCDDLHSLAASFIQHPLRNHELIAACESNLNLMRAKRNGSSHHCYGLAIERVMWIVNRQQNMRSV
jgi:hypothetical protein